MRRDILFICNTYYQLIVAMQCRNTIFSDDTVDVILSDHSKNTESIVKKLLDTNIFRNVNLLRTKDMDQGNHTKLQVIKELRTSVLGHSGLFTDALMDKEYDELIYYNMNSSVMSIYSVLVKRNNNLKCSRMEEGIVTYNNQFNEPENSHYTKRIDLTVQIRKLLGKKNITDNYHNFYCFFPTYYHGAYTPIGIPLIKADDIIRQQLAKTFELSNKDYIEEKYIFFTSVYDFEGGNQIGEFETIKKVANLVRTDNLIVKIHPRDTRTVYQENGIKVAKASAVPWEALQLYFGYEDKILLTATSSAIISINLMVSNPIKSYFLFNVCNIEGNPLAVNTVNTLRLLIRDNDLHKKMEKIHIAENIEEILQ